MTRSLMHDKRFQCVVCKSEFEYGELLLQIGEQAIGEARKAHSKRKS